MGQAVTATFFSGLTEAQRQDAEHFDAHWREMMERGKIELVVPPDEEMWQRDLGRSLGVTFEWLGDLRGKRVLELGCGPGDYTILMARRGADVTALDIAPSSLHITRERAEASGVGGAVHVSWMAAETLALLAITQVGDEIVSANNLYGGTYQLFHYTFPKLGREVKFVDSQDPKAFKAAITPKTRAIYAETVGNPKLDVIDIEKLAKIARFSCR
jgi:SAM-dependent methyltransferase